MTAKRVLVVGANGFIGRHIVSAAAARLGGGGVIAGVRRRIDPAEFPPDTEQRIVDVTDPASFAAAIDGVTHVVGSVMGSDAGMIAAARLGADAAASGRIERFVHLSSIAVHGDATGIAHETMTDAPPADRYAAAKQEGERIVHRNAPGASVILRPGLVYGPGSALWTTRIARLLITGRLGDLGEAGEGTAALVHVDDVAEAAVSACLRPDAAGGIYHLVAAPAPSWNRYLADFGVALGIEPRAISPARLHAERLAAYPLYGWARVARRLGLPVPETITPGMARLFGQRVDYESSAVPVLLPGWRDYHAGLADSARWVRERAG